LFCEDVEILWKDNDFQWLRNLYLERSTIQNKRNNQDTKRFFLQLANNLKYLREGKDERARLARLALERVCQHKGKKRRKETHRDNLLGRSDSPKYLFSLYPAIETLENECRDAIDKENNIIFSGKKGGPHETSPVLITFWEMVAKSFQKHTGRRVGISPNGPFLDVCIEIAKAFYLPKPSCQILKKALNTKKKICI
jgi:hypothetical protein